MVCNLSPSKKRSDWLLSNHSRYALNQNTIKCTSYDGEIRGLNATSCDFTKFKLFSNFTADLNFFPPNIQKSEIPILKKHTE